MTANIDAAKYESEKTLRKGTLSISTFIALASVIVPIIIFFLQDKNKELSYEIIGFSEIANVNFASDKLELTYDGKKINKLGLLSVRISNSGGVPIRHEDFERPILLKLGERPEILKSRMGQSLPTNLKPQLTTVGTAVEVAPLLLNPGDNFIVEIITSSDYPKLEVDARIAGIKSAKLSEKAVVFNKGMPHGFTIVATVLSFATYTFMALAFGLSRLLINKNSVVTSLPLAKIEAWIVVLLMAVSASILFVGELKLFPKFEPVILLESVLPMIFIGLYFIYGRSWVATRLESQTNNDEKAQER